MFFSRRFSSCRVLPVYFIFLFKKRISFFVHTTVLSLKTAFNLVKIHLLFRIMILIQWSVNISIFVNHVVIVFWGPNEGDQKRTYIPRLFSEYMLTFRVEEPVKMCVANQIRNIIYVIQLSDRVYIMWHSRLRIYIPWMSHEGKYCTKFLNQYSFIYVVNFI